MIVGSAFVKRLADGTPQQGLVRSQSFFFARVLAVGLLRRHNLKKTNADFTRVPLSM